MSQRMTRRHFVAQVAGATLAARGMCPAAEPARARVVIARDEVLTRGRVDEHRELLRKLLDASVQKLTGKPDARAAWRSLFRPTERVGLKVNTLGFSTHPAVTESIVAGLREAGIPAGNIVIWDRFDVELARAGYRISRGPGGVRCLGTDAEQIGSGYQTDVQTSGRIGSCFSRILAEQIDALVSVPVLKDHNLAGVSLGMKNFFGAIHNPNKYHDNNCDPYIVDVVSHRYIRPRWRLTVLDGTRAQYNAGPAVHPAFAWEFGGLLVGTDFVAVDAVGADLLDRQRRAKGLKSLSEDGRPPRHIATAAQRGLGVADLSRIDRVEL